MLFQIIYIKVISFEYFRIIYNKISYTFHIVLKQNYMNEKGLEECSQWCFIGVL